MLKMKNLTIELSARERCDIGFMISEEIERIERDIELYERVEIGTEDLKKYIERMTDLYKKLKLD